MLNVRLDESRLKNVFGGNFWQFYGFLSHFRYECLHIPKISYLFRPIPAKSPLNP